MRSGSGGSAAIPASSDALPTVSGHPMRVIGVIAAGVRRTGPRAARRPPSAPARDIAEWCAEAGPRSARRPAAWELQLVARLADGVASGPARTRARRRASAGIRRRARRRRSGPLTLRPASTGVGRTRGQVRDRPLGADDDDARRARASPSANLAMLRGGARLARGARNRLSAPRLGAGVGPAGPPAGRRERPARSRRAQSPAPRSPVVAASWLARWVARRASIWWYPAGIWPLSPAAAPPTRAARVGTVLGPALHRRPAALGRHLGARLCPRPASSARSRAPWSHGTPAPGPRDRSIGAGRPRPDSGGALRWRSVDCRFAVVAVRRPVRCEHDWSSRAPARRPRSPALRAGARPASWRSHSQ